MRLSVLAPAVAALVEPGKLKNDELDRLAALIDRARKGEHLTPRDLVPPHAPQQEPDVLAGLRHLALRRQVDLVANHNYVR